MACPVRWTRSPWTAVRTRPDVCLVREHGEQVAEDAGVVGDVGLGVEGVGQAVGDSDLGSGRSRKVQGDSAVACTDGNSYVEPSAERTSDTTGTP